MSQRELRALTADQRKDSSTRKRTRSSTRSNRDMDEERKKIAELEAKLEEALSTIEEQKVELERANESDVQMQQRLDNAQAELETVTLRAEVEKLRAVEKVRNEERERSQAWVGDLRERFKTEKAVLEEKIAMLEARSTSGASTSATSASPSGSTTGVTTTVSTSTPSTTVTTTASGALSTAISSTSATSSAQLFERARMLEQHKRQFTASAACRTETPNKKTKPNVPTGASRPLSSTANQKSQKPQENVSTPASSPKFVRLCHFCREPGHFARNCPLRSKDSKHESPGRSVNASTARTSSVEVKGTTEQKELTEEELEFLLARCRLQKEQQMLQTAPEGNVACVEATPPQHNGSVIGPLLYCDLEVEGVPVVSMVDCGS